MSFDETLFLKIAIVSAIFKFFFFFLFAFLYVVIKTLSIDLVEQGNILNVKCLLVSW